MVHSAVKLRSCTEEYRSSASHHESTRDSSFSLPKTTPNTVLRSTPPAHLPHTVPSILEMMTPHEFASVLRTRVRCLISQWPLYTSQPPYLLDHGLPSPSSSGSPLVQQQSQTSKRMTLEIVHAFVAFFYPEEHPIHQSGDLSPVTLFAHLEGLQTLLTFLSSKELRVIIRNRLVSSSDRSASVQAIVEVIRNVSVEEEEESEELDSTWKQLWRKTTTPHASTNSPVRMKTFVDVGVTTDSSFGIVPPAMATISRVSVPRPSSSDGSRPSKRSKHTSSNSLLQDSADDFRTTSSVSLPNPPMNNDHPHVPGTATSSMSMLMSMLIPKMADPILRPVSTQSFKSPPITSALDDDGEADAEGDTDTDVEMNVDLAVDVNERADDKAAMNTLTGHPLTKGTIKPRIGTPLENASASTSAAAAGSPSIIVIPSDTTNILASSSRLGDIPRGPRAMRSLMSNESTYSVPFSSGSRTPSIPSLNNFSRESPFITTPATMPSMTLQAKQELLSNDGKLTTNAAAGELRGSYPVKSSEQTHNDSQPVNEPTSRQTEPIAYSVKPSGPLSRRLQGNPSPTSPIFAPRSPVLASSSTSSSLSSVLKSTITVPFRYEGPELPHDEVMASNISSKSTAETGAATLTSVRSRSKQSRRNRKPPKSPARFSGRSQKSFSCSRSRSRSSSRSRSVNEKRHRLPQKKTLAAKYEPHSMRNTNSTKYSHSQSDKRVWDISSRSSSRSTSRSRSRSESRSRVPYRLRNYSYSRPPSPSSSKDRHWSPEPSRRRERGRSRSRKRRGDENQALSRASNGMDHWSPGRDRRA